MQMPEPEPEPEPQLPEPLAPAHLPPSVRYSTSNTSSMGEGRACPPASGEFLWCELGSAPKGIRVAESPAVLSKLQQKKRALALVRAHPRP